MQHPPTNHFWSGKRVVVTAAKGFLGSHLCLALRALGARVTALDELDLRDPQAVLLHWAIARPQVVLDLSASQAKDTADALLIGANVLQGSLLSGAEAVVTVGADGSSPDDDPTERALLAQCQESRGKGTLRTPYVSPATVYGEGQRYDSANHRVIPALLRNIHAAQRNGQDRIVCHGEACATQELLHVSDAVRGILLTAEHYDAPEPLHLGTGVATSSPGLVRLVRQLSGFRGQVVFASGSPSRAPLRYRDASQARRTIGFAARVSLRTGLARTVAWFVVQSPAHPPASSSFSPAHDTRRFDRDELLWRRPTARYSSAASESSHPGYAGLPALEGFA